MTPASRVVGGGDGGEGKKNEGEGRFCRGWKGGGIELEWLMLRGRGEGRKKSGGSSSCDGLVLR